MAVKKKNTQIMTRQTEEVGTVVPSFMQKYSGMGTEVLKGDDVEVPRIKLLQALSPELDEFNEAEKGSFWHAMADAALGESIRIVPVWVDVSYILWRPREMGGGILARAADGIHWSPDHGEFKVTLKNVKEPVTWTLAKTVVASGLGEWGSMNPADNNSPPAATRMYNVVCVMPDLSLELSPAVVTLQRSAIGVARKFLGKMKISNAPSFGQYYTMEAVEDTNKTNDKFYNYKFTKAGFVENEEDLEKYHQTYQAFKDMGLRIRNLESLQDDDREGGQDDPAGDNKKF